jgi:hypothetical protein
MINLFFGLLDIGFFWIGDFLSSNLVDLRPIIGVRFLDGLIVDYTFSSILLSMISVKYCYNG